MASAVVEHKRMYQERYNIDDSVSEEEPTAHNKKVSKISAANRKEKEAEENDIVSNMSLDEDGESNEEEDMDEDNDDGSEDNEEKDSEIHDSEKEMKVSKKRKISTDAYTKTIITLMNAVSYEGEFVFNLPRRLPRITVAFVTEILPLWMEANMYKRVKHALFLLTSEYKDFRSKKEV